jgi:antitoxin VapB
MIYISTGQGRMEKRSRRKRNAATSVVRPKRSVRKGHDAAPSSKTDTGLKKASLFMNGRSQAVRLPKEFRFEGTHVYAKKEGNRVILSPVDDRIERLIALMGSIPDFPDIPKAPAEPMRPEIKEYFRVSD